MKKIVVACGSGVATSTAVGHKIADLLVLTAFPVSTTSCSAPSLRLRLSAPTLYFWSQPLSLPQALPASM